ncbi:MAG: helix-turn-helix domain-containing protein [Candidatus Schekmanbacteria bacterium]|nr:helix-turn-helix domain-containing protein [Candidatus Schekmanbacteria bacterium]
MRPRKSSPPGTTERLEQLLSTCNSDAERRRIQAVYLRAKYGFEIEQIAQMTGLKTQTVRNIHSLFLKKGEVALKLSGKGGRRNFHLDLKKEAAFLFGFEAEAKTGGIEVSRIHIAYQKKVGKTLPLSTIYRMLHKYGWRRFAYRPGLWYPPQDNNSE